MLERLQKILAQAGVASRRDAEKFIIAGRVKVNGHVIRELGAKADGDYDKIYVDGDLINVKKKVYYMFNKPRGVVTTLYDPEGRKCLSDFVKNLPERVFPVGRLDYNTEGLLLLTNDGNLTQILTHPSHEVSKMYLVKSVGIIPDRKLDKLRMGVELEDGVTAPAIVNLRSYDYEKNVTYFDITIHEGRNRQVRRMCDVIGFPVRDLKRIKIGSLTLSGLGKGKIRELEDAEIKSIRQSEIKKE